MKKRILSLAMALAMCLGLCAAAGAANPVAVSNGGLSVTISDVISEEDVTVDLLDYDGNLDKTVELHVYHLPVKVVFTPENNVFDGQAGFSEAYYLIGDGSLTNVGGSGGFGSDGIWHKGEAFEGGDFFLKPDQTEPNTELLYRLCVSVSDGEDLSYEVEIYYMLDNGTVSLSGQNAPSQPPADGTPAAPQISFTDVPAGSWYAQAVDWAVAQGITNGTGAGTFSPADTCTRAQILTFLWRANGSPEPSQTESRCVLDLPAGQYYTQAVLWAEENGLIYSLTPVEALTEDCTRQEVVLYLWELAGSPGSSRSLPFTDVPGGMALYVAVGWAMDREITGGTSVATFSPDGTCTRAEIVTFLFRAYA